MTGLSDKKRWVLLIILVSYLMIVLDISIVITGLPQISADLHFQPLLFPGYRMLTLAFGGLLLLGARAGDILGRKRMFLTGLGLFTLASMMVGLAPTASFMLASRMLQGIGAAILAPSTLALLTTNFEEGSERNNAVGYYGATAGFCRQFRFGCAGGIFAGWLSWRVGFFINLPIGILLFIGARKYIVETEKHTGQFDLFGALSSTVGMSLLVYGIVRSSEEGLTGFLRTVNTIYRCLIDDYFCHQ